MSDTPEKPTETMPALSTMPMAQPTGGLQLVPQTFNEVLRLADLMSNTGVAVRKQFRGDAGACLMLCQQALRWEMDPFAVANKAYIVNDQIAYEAQLIAAVVHTRAGLKELPTYEFDGEGETLTCKVTATRKDGKPVSYESPPLGSIKTKNSPLWKDDPQQQLGYFSIRSWARRYTPEVTLGVYDPEEAAQMKDITPQVDQGQMMKGLPGQTEEGFQPATEVAFEEVDAETGEIITGPVGEVAETLEREAARNAAAIGDENIDTSDIPEASEEFFKNAELVLPDEKPDAAEECTVAADMQAETETALAADGCDPEGPPPEAATQDAQEPEEPAPAPDAPEGETAADEALPSDPVECAKFIHNALRGMKTKKAAGTYWMNHFKAPVAKRKGIERDALESIFMAHEDRASGSLDKEDCKKAVLHQIERITGAQK